MRCALASISSDRSYSSVASEFTNILDIRRPAPAILLCYYDRLCNCSLFVTWRYCFEARPRLTTTLYSPVTGKQFWCIITLVCSRIMEELIAHCNNTFQLAVNILFTRAWCQVYIIRIVSEWLTISLYSEFLCKFNDNAIEGRFTLAAWR